MLAGIPLGARRDLIPGLLWLTYVQNQHGAMGLFGNNAAILIVLAFAVSCALGYVLRDIIASSAFAQIGFGAVLGGAAGNVIDRATHGFVVDFVVVRGFYIFNTADAFVTLGVVAIVIASLRSR